MSAEDFEFGMELARGIAVGSEVLAAAGEMEQEVGLDKQGRSTHWILLPRTWPR